MSKWILCNDQIPTEEGYYLVTVKDKNKIWVTEAELEFLDKDKKEYVFGTYGDNGCFALNVIAWQLLPEPYKAESEVVRKND